jgi:hypothetical protein
MPIPRMMKPNGARLLVMGAQLSAFALIAVAAFSCPARAQTPGPFDNTHILCANTGARNDCSAGIGLNQFLAKKADAVSGTLQSPTINAPTITNWTALPANLPAATTSSLGAVQIGTGLGVSGGTASVQYGTTSTTAYRGDLGAAASAAANAALPATSAGPLATQAGASSAAAIANGLGFTPGAFTSKSLAAPPYGAVCNGTTDDSTAILAAVASGAPFTIPAGTTCLGLSVAYTALSGIATGPGRIETSDTTVRAPILTSLDAIPSSYNTCTSELTCWAGDNSHTIAHEHIVTGAGTLGTPSTGYLRIQEASGDILRVLNTSGNNTSTSSNDGRTALSGHFTGIFQSGQGDFVGNFVSGTVGSAKSGATSFLASPEVGGFGASLTATIAGTYMEGVGDISLNDNGHDVAGVGLSLVMNRTAALEAIGAYWDAIQIQGGASTAPIDAFFRASKSATIGFDLSSADLSAYRLGALTLTAGSGTGYAVNDLITVSGGTFSTPTVFQVNAIGTGGTLPANSLTVVNTGIYSVPPVTGFSALTTTTSGGGSGVVVTAVYTDNNLIILPPNGGCVAIGQTVGAVNTVATGYNGRLCVTPSGVQIGNTTNVNTAPANSNGLQVGVNHNMSASNNIELGQGTYDEAQVNCQFFSSGIFSGVIGSSQSRFCLFRGATVATAGASVRLTTNNLTTIAQNSLLIVANSDHNLTFKITARDESNGDTANWKIHSGSFTRVSGNAVYSGDLSTATAPDYSTGSGSGATFQVTADTTNQAANFNFVAPTADPHIWRVTMSVSDDETE